MITYTTLVKNLKLAELILNCCRISAAAQNDKLIIECYMIENLIGNYMGTIFSLLFCLSGLVIALIGVYFLVKAVKSNSWSSTTGSILTSEAVKIINKEL